jgi:hypothetical protein
VSLRLTEQELLDLAEELLTGWYTPVDMTGDRRKHPEVTLVVWGLAAHVHRLAGAYLQLYRQGMVLEAMPLLRSAFEPALTCAWANEMPDALPALGNENHRRWAALVRTLSGPRWPVDEETRAAWQAVSHEPATTSSDGSAKHFERLCNDLLQAGDQAYGLYRIMSSQTHPTMTIIERYLQAPGSDHANLSHDPKPESSSERWLLLVCASMVWAGRAFDFHDRDRPRREELRRAAKALGVPDRLVLANEARVRSSKRPSRPSGGARPSRGPEAHRTGRTTTPSRAPGRA